MKMLWNNCRDWVWVSVNVFLALTQLGYPERRLLSGLLSPHKPWFKNGFMIGGLSRLQGLEAKSLFSACIAECRICIGFLLSSPDDEVSHNFHHFGETRLVLHFLLSPYSCCWICMWQIFYLCCIICAVCCCLLRLMLLIWYYSSPLMLQFRFHLPKTFTEIVRDYWSAVHSFIHSFIHIYLSIKCNIKFTKTE